MARNIAQKPRREKTPAVGSKPKRTGIIEKFLGSPNTGRNTARKKTSKFKKAK
jgi:hypothetical protein